MDAAAALVSSLAFTTAFYPIHRVKVLLQTQDVIPDIKNGHRPRYAFVTSFGRLIKEQGVLSLWHGNSAWLLRRLPSTTLSFTLNDVLRERVVPHYDHTTQPVRHLAANLSAGFMAGASAAGQGVKHKTPNPGSLSHG